MLLSSVFLCLFLVYLLIKLFEFWFKERSLPGPKGLPFLGIAVELAQAGFTEVLQYAEKNIKAYGGLMELNIVGINNYLLTDPEAVEAVLSSSVHISKGVEYDIMKSWLCDGLLLSDGAKWHNRRKLLTPAFHFKILEDAQRIISKNADIFVNNLLASGGQPTNVDDIACSSTLNVICESAMGVILNPENKQGNEYVEALKRATKGIAQRYLTFWLKNEFVYKLSSQGKAFFKDIGIMHLFTNKVIENRREIYLNKVKNESNDKGRRKAFLDCLLELEVSNPGAININEEVDTFMFEGHDTTSAALIFALYLLANHKEEQEKAAEEQMELFGTDERAPTMQDLNKMPYLEMVIKETLRLFPSVPLISRSLKQNLVLGEKVTLPAGSNVIIMPYFVHRYKGYWDHPEEFRPERFYPGISRHPFSFIPFSAGPRNCIGQKFAMMELKILLSSMLRKCRLEPVTKKLKLLPIVILKNDTPIFIKVYPRKTNS